MSQRSNEKVPASLRTSFKQQSENPYIDNIDEAFTDGGKHSVASSKYKSNGFTYESGSSSKMN